MTRESNQRGLVDLERFATIVGAYGADSSSWPDDEREAALALLASSEEAARMQQEAAALDAFLDDVPDVRPSTALRSRILEQAPRRSSSWAERWNRFAEVVWPFGPRWQPVAALAAAAVLGVVVGVAVPQASPSDTSTTDVTEMAFGADVDWSVVP
jgi:hypothetical protein